VTADVALKTSSADAVPAMNGSAATAPAKYDSLIFLLNVRLDVVRMGRLPVCLFFGLI
jgi:hypothetical protein